MNEARQDYEQFERRQIVLDRDNRRVETLDIDESRAREIVRDLKDADIVVAVPENQCLAHHPSGEMFDSNTALAYFHRGWEAANDEG